MTMVVVGIIIVIAHVIVLGCLILWFGLGMPTSKEKLVAQFKAQFLGHGRRLK